MTLRRGLAKFRKAKPRDPQIAKGRDELAREIQVLDLMGDAERASLFRAVLNEFDRLSYAESADTLEQRFWAKVEKTDGCWRWIGAAKRGGRGHLAVVSADGRRQIMAHRISYELHNGPIAPGLVVCHSCDNGWCVNPSHLWLGTQAENVADMDAKGRRRTNSPRRDVCRRGHPMSGDNVVMRKGGIGRSCRACQSERYLRRRAERAAMGA